MLQVTGLSKSFGAIQALNKVDIEIAKGRIHGIIGPNGSGKTTLFNCVTGLLRPNAGTVALDGMEITNDRPESHRPERHPADIPGRQARPRHDGAGKRHVRGQRWNRRGGLDAALRLPFVRSRRETEIRERAMAALAGRAWRRARAMGERPGLDRAAARADRARPGRGAEAPPPGRAGVRHGRAGDQKGGGDHSEGPGHRRHGRRREPRREDADEPLRPRHGPQLRGKDRGRRSRPKSSTNPRVLEAYLGAE